MSTSQIVPRLGDALDALRAERVPKEVVHAVQREQGDALVRTARVEGRAYVAWPHW